MVLVGKVLDHVTESVDVIGKADAVTSSEFADDHSVERRKDRRQKALEIDVAHSDGHVQIAVQARFVDVGGQRQHEA